MTKSLVPFIFQIMFSSVLFKKLPLETGVSVICLSPGVVLTNVVSVSITPFSYKCRMYTHSDFFRTSFA